MEIKSPLSSKLKATSQPKGLKKSKISYSSSEKAKDNASLLATFIAMMALTALRTPEIEGSAGLLVHIMAWLFSFYLGRSMWQIKETAATKISTRKE